MYKAPGAIFTNLEHSTSISYGDIGPYVQGSGMLAGIATGGSMSMAPSWSPVTDTHISGGICEGFVRDWYNRIHIMPAYISLGNILSKQVRYIRLWNSYKVPHDLLSVVAEGNNGVTLEEPIPAPTTFGIYEERVYKLTVGLDGDPSLSAVYTFTFDSEVLKLHVTGDRIVVFSFVPESDLVEVYEWKTDIIQTKEREQRISVRSLPRRVFLANYVFDDLDASRARLLVGEYGARQYGYPIWSEARYSGIIPSGSTEISVDTSCATYVLGDLALIYQSDDYFESGVILEINPNSIVIKQPLEKDFTDAFVMPMVFAYATEGLSLSRSVDCVTKSNTSFESIDNLDIGHTDKTQLRGHDILLDRSVMVSSLSEKVVRESTVIDDKVGIISVHTNKNYPEFDQTISFDCLSRQELWEVKRWLFTLRGKQRGFFLPTWSQDIQPTADIYQADTVLSIKKIGLYIYPKIRDILIVSKSGEATFNKITSSAEDGANNVEIVTLDSQVGRDIPLDNLACICFINFVRLDTDRIEIKHRTAEASSIILPIKKVPEV